MRLLSILALLVVYTTAAPRFSSIQNLLPTGYIRRGYVPLEYLRRNLLQRGLVQLGSREDSSEKFQTFRLSSLGSSEEKIRTFRLSSRGSSGENFRTYRLSRRGSSKEKVRTVRLSRRGSSEERYRAFKSPNPGSSKCDSDEVLNDFGSCENAHVTRNVYAFTAPKSKYPIIIPGEVPNPEIDLNIVFVKAPHLPDIPRPFVLPPPQQKTVVYVLSENQNLKPQVIEVPSPNTEDPEVYFVNYESGENPQLPGGVDLRTALSQMPNGSSDVDSNEGSSRGSNSFESIVQLSSYGRAAQDQFDDDSASSFITKIAPETVTKLDSIEKY